MRLIDADALPIRHPVGRPAFIDPKDVESALTVSCLDCEYAMPNTCYCKWLDSWFSRRFGCAHFERREP